MAYTFDSEIDPKIFVNWERVGSVQTSPCGGYVLLKNPNQDDKIKEAIIEIFKNGIVAYEYSIEGKTYKYIFNKETKNYDLVVPKE